jgi:hypothetical protein
MDGMTLFVARVGPGHYARSEGQARLVLIRRSDDGATTAQILTTPPAADTRDPNITVAPDGSVILSWFTAQQGAYTNYTATLTSEGTLRNVAIISIDNLIAWGNTLTTPSGRKLRGAYAAKGGAVLLSGLGNQWERGPILFADAPDEHPTEPTLAYWGDRLVAVARLDIGASAFLYRETTDLEGLTGWSDVRRIALGAPVWVHSPALEPLIPSGADLVLFGALRRENGARFPYAVRTRDGVTWSRGVVFDLRGGAYPAAVQTAAGTYDLLYHSEQSGTVATLLYRRVEITNKLPFAN